MKPKKEYLPDWNLVRTTELTNSEKALLFILKYHYGRNEYTSVGQKCLASESRLSRTTVGTLLRSIERKGWINITNREYATCEYRLNPDKFRVANTSNSTSPVESDDNPLTNDATGGCSTSEHKGNITKTVRTKNTDQEVKAFAGKPATALLTINSKEYVEENEHIASTKPNTPPPNVATLEKIWKSVHQEKYPDKGFVAELTSKQRGMLKHFIQRLGSGNESVKVFELVLAATKAPSIWAV